MAGAPTRLRCEFLTNPLGIEALRPSLSWLVNDDRPAEVQTAWQILAASQPGLLNEAQADLWDSGRVIADGALAVPYGGAALIGRQRVWWTVQTFDSDGLPSGFSQPAFFEMGLLHPADWHAQWVGSPALGSRSVPAPAPLLIRDFVIAAMPRRARLYLAACGHCQVHLNGRDLELGALAPAASDYRHRVRYRTLDVTGELTRGVNRLGVLLFDGSYAGNVTRRHQRQQYGDRPLLLAQLEVVAADGRVQRIVSDGQWRCAASGWLVSDRVLGEHFDARQQGPFWSRAPLADEAEVRWQPVQPFPAPTGQLTADTGPRLAVQRRLQAQEPPLLVVDEWQGTALRYRFDEPIYGQVAVSAPLQPGARIALHYQSAGGIGDDDSLPLAQRTVEDAEDSITAAGPLHGFQGGWVLRRFQSVTVSGDVNQAQPPQVQALRIGSLEPAQLVFETDCAALQRLHQQLYADLEAGCSTQPLTGIGIESGLAATGQLASVLPLLGRCHGAAPMLRAWVDDMVDAESRRGDLPRVVPAVLGEPVLRSGGGTEALALTVWTLYRQLGDIDTLQRAFGSISRLLAVMNEAAPDQIRWATGAQDNQVPGDLVGTAWYFQTARLAAQMANVLGKADAQRQFEALAARVRFAFRRRFVTADGTIVSRTQTAAAMALDFGLLDAAEQPQALAGLVTSLQREGLLVQAGFLGQLLKLLCQHGHGAVAQRLMTVPANSDRLLHRYGRNMVTAGALEWVYGSLLGIELLPDIAPGAVACRRLRVAPAVSLQPADSGLPPLQRVAGRCQSARGEIAVAWELRQQALELRIVLPPDTSAELVLPGCAPEPLAAGSHERSIDLGAQPVDAIPQLAPDADLMQDPSGYPQAS